MAYDGIFLYSIVDELNKNTLNLKIDKVNQPEKDEINLVFRGGRKLLLSASPIFPRVHLTSISKANPSVPPTFCMVLRKYLISSKLIKISQLEMDRIIILDFESTDELGFNSIYSLICEIMGRHSNISLVRQRDNKIMDCIKHITPDINTYRVLLPGVDYKYPPKSKKLDPSNFTKEDFELSFKSLSSFTDKSLSYIFTGISKNTSMYMYDKILKKDNPYDEIKKIFDGIFIKHDFKYKAYLKDGILKDFSCIPLTNFKDYSAKYFPDASVLLDYYYAEKDKQDRIHSRTMDIQKLIHTNMERISKKLDILNNSLKDCLQKDSFKLKGELLTANVYAIKQGMDSINVLNYYSECGEHITIYLDKNKTPSQNIQKYFNKYTKLKKTESAAKEQIKISEEELSYLNSVLISINTLESYDEIEDIKNELIESGYIKHRKSRVSKSRKSKPMHFISSTGIDIYVGKNNVQNDFLTTRFSERTDTWMHTKGIPGSHVIIRGKNVDDVTLKEGAALAAYYSKGRSSSKIPVDYTEVRNVKKPAHAKPGMVIYFTNKTIYVDPENLNLKRIE